MRENAQALEDFENAVSIIREMIKPLELVSLKFVRHVALQYFSIHCFSEIGNFESTTEPGSG